MAIGKRLERGNHYFFVLIIYLLIGGLLQEDLPLQSLIIVFR